MWKPRAQRSSDRLQRLLTVSSEKWKSEIARNSADSAKDDGRLRSASLTLDDKELLGKLVPAFAKEEGVTAAELVGGALDALAGFAPRFQAGYDAGIARKLGLPGDSEADTVLGAEFLGLLGAREADFTLTFRHLARLQAGRADEAPLRAALADDPALEGWLARWRERSAETAPGGLLHFNPAYIPRNHRVEAAIAAAQERDDFGPFEELLAVLAEPFVEHPGYADYENPPKPEERVLRTFCGT